MQYRILVADDEMLSLAATQHFLQARGYTVDVASSGEETIAKVKASPCLYAIVILDYRMKGVNGAATAEAILAINPDLYILMLSGDDSRDALKSSWRAGAVGFIEKGEDLDAFGATIQNWCRKYEETYLTVTLASSLSKDSEAIAALGMVGRSRALTEIADRVRRYAGKKDTLLIIGETGTGKEKVARALHKGDAAKFFVVNCAAYNGSAELMESDLFGYVRGAFTGANRDHTGVFESAEGGTIFLDEVHTLDLRAQQKLLRVIQEKSVRPLGSVREYTVNFRLIAAAKPELEQLAIDGVFLPDLFERLNVLRIDIPPLRDRPEDIEPLVAYFCERYERETNEPRRFLARTVRYLEKYPWPRNVRELENAVRRLCVDSTEEKISPEHLDARFFQGAAGAADDAAPAPLKERWDELLRKEIEDALTASTSQREAARRLGMPESSLRRIVRKHGIAVARA